MVLPMKTMILKSKVASDEDEPAVRDVKTAVRVNLRPRYAGPDVQDFLHKSTTLDPRFKSLDATAPLRVYNELTAEIVTNIQQGQATDTTGANPETADDRGSPPENKSAMAELFGELFTTQEQGTKSKVKVIEEEVTSYREVDCIPLDADPLTWWKTKELIYPHVAILAWRYLAVPGTSVPSERVFSTAADIVTASPSDLTADHVDRLILLKKN
uniref:HAT C-terminal dimerisation domain-containing protein n=1 Tax=Hucho hucho TaxID=62062 RepID=A0A4W5K7U4_9TELE